MKKAIIFLALTLISIISFAQSTAEDYTSNDTTLILAIIVIIIIIALVLWLYIFLPAKMARKRGRNVVGWILLFWIITPLWGIIALLVLGDSKKKILEDIIKELHQN